MTDEAADYRLSKIEKCLIEIRNAIIIVGMALNENSNPRSEASEALKKLVSEYALFSART